MPGKAGAARNHADASAATQAVRATAAAAAALVVVALGVGKGAAADQAPAAGGSLQPGLWEMAVELKSIEIPGAPPETQARMSSEVGRSQVNQECMTAEQARNPIQEMREGMARSQAASCRFFDEVFADGVIRIRATCPATAVGGSGGEISMEGSFTATTLQATLNVSTQGPNPAMQGATGIRMTTDIRGRRVGECPPPLAVSPAPSPRP
jgi:hypothetical protein